MAPDVVIGTMTEVELHRVLAFDVAPTGGPGDHVRVELADGTGHGARITLTVTGTDPGRARRGRRDVGHRRRRTPRGVGRRVGAGAAGGGVSLADSTGTLVRVAQEVPPVELIEHATKERLGREAAAERLRRLADQLSRHNEVAFSRDGLRYTVDVPDEVEFSLEVEIGDDGSEIEVEIEWWTRPMLSSLTAR